MDIRLTHIQKQTSSAAEQSSSSGANERKRKSSPSAQSGSGSEQTHISPEPPAAKRSAFNYRVIRQLSPEGPHIRYVDSSPQPLCFIPHTPVTLEALTDLDYRVVPQLERVKEKLEKAEVAAKVCSETRPVKKSKNFTTCCEKKIKLLMTNADGLTINRSYGPWGSCFQLQNSREYVLQDAFAFDQFKYRIEGHSSHIVKFAGVFDGHGTSGREAALFTSINIPDCVIRRIQDYAVPECGLNDAVIWNAHKTGFTDCDRHLGEHYQDGTTASLSSFFNKDLWTANTGDSRQILLKPDDSFLSLTECAFPQKPACQKQVKKRGGIMSDNGKRIKGSGESSLGMTGSIGDKKYLGASNPRPKVVVTRQPASGWKDHYLIMGTDGLWDRVSDGDICKVISNLRKNGLPLTEITETLAWSARKAGSHDDISVAIINLEHMAKVSNPETRKHTEASTQTTSTDIL